jgi:drug/metabolite transporter (DMT)-like permease
LHTISSSELLALGCAFAWALNGLLLRSQLLKVSPPLINVVRCGMAGLFYWLLLPFDSAPLAAFSQVTLGEWGLLLGNVVIGLVIADVLYLTSIREIGLSRTLALTGVFPLATLLWEHLLLQQPLNPDLLLGSCLVVVGVILLAGQVKAKSGAQEVGAERLKFGIFISLVAAVLWGLSTVLIKPAMAHMTAVQANAVRMPLVSLLLYLTRVWPNENENLARLDWRTVGVLSLTGILGMGIGGLMFLAALKDLGPARAVTITSVSPVFGLIFGVVFLKERLSVRIVAGVVFCVAGVWAVL